MKQAAILFNLSFAFRVSLLISQIDVLYVLFLYNITYMLYMTYKNKILKERYSESVNFSIQKIDL